MYELPHTVDAPAISCHVQCTVIAAVAYAEHLVSRGRKERIQLRERIAVGPERRGKFCQWACDARAWRRALAAPRSSRGANSQQENGEQHLVCRRGCPLAAGRRQRSTEERPRLLESEGSAKSAEGRGGITWLWSSCGRTDTQTRLSRRRARPRSGAVSPPLSPGLVFFVSSIDPTAVPSLALYNDTSRSARSCARAPTPASGFLLFLAQHHAVPPHSAHPHGPHTSPDPTTHERESKTFTHAVTQSQGLGLVDDMYSYALLRRDIDTDGCIDNL